VPAERACRLLDHVLALVTCPLSLVVPLPLPQPTRLGSIAIGIEIAARFALPNQVRRSLVVARLAQPWLLALRECLCMLACGLGPAGDKTPWGQTTFPIFAFRKQMSNGSVSPRPATNPGPSRATTMMPSATGTGWQT
jgi:ceramide glucosyltransferase